MKCVLLPQTVAIKLEAHNCIECLYMLLLQFPFTVKAQTCSSMTVPLCTKHGTCRHGLPRLEWSRWSPAQSPDFNPTEHLELERWPNPRPPHWPRWCSSGWMSAGGCAPGSGGGPSQKKGGYYNSEWLTNTEAGCSRSTCGCVGHASKYFWTSCACLTGGYQNKYDI